MYEQPERERLTGRFVSSTVERIYSVARIIRGLPCEDGDAREIYAPAIISWRQPRQCAWCRKEFSPQYPAAKMQRFCGTSCSAKWRMTQPEIKAKVHTPDTFRKIKAGRRRWMRDLTPEQRMEFREKLRAVNRSAEPEVRKRISDALRAIGHKPKIRGGNGTGMTNPQRLLLAMLPEGWEAEYAISLGKLTTGFPTNYKLDLGNPQLKLGIELDGHKHRISTQREKDAKKDRKLAELGWTVLRFWNWDILTWIATGMKTETCISMTLKQHGIRLSR